MRAAELGDRLESSRGLPTSIGCSLVSERPGMRLSIWPSAYLYWSIPRALLPGSVIQACSASPVSTIPFSVLSPGMS